MKTVSQPSGPLTDCVQIIDQLNALQDLIGIGYHPDTDATQYIDADGNNVFTEEQAHYWNTVLTAGFSMLEEQIYEIALERQHAMIEQMEPNTDLF